MSSRAGGEVPEYAEAPREGRAVARFRDKSVEIAVGRVRSYPSLSGEAPDTRGFYELAAVRFEGARRILDVGCGAGKGARLLAETCEEVIAVDTDRSAVEFATAHAPRAKVLLADFAKPPSIVAADAAVVVDVLGHARDPLTLLRSVHACLAPGALVMVAEARASPTQTLRAPARRAFSGRALEALLAAAGFQVEERGPSAGPFVMCVARRVEDPACDALMDAVRSLREGNPDGASAALHRAAESSRTAVRAEALVSLGELLFACGDGDGAARAHFAARTADPSDPRADAGLARLSLAMGERTDALMLARAARALDPSDVTAACALAMAMNGPAAAEQLRVASALAPDDATIAITYAVKAGTNDSAIYAMERARRYGDVLPSHFHVVLANLLLRDGRTADATIEARLAEATAPDSAEVAALWKTLRS